MRLHLDRERDEPLLWEETVVLDPAELGPDLIAELSPIAVRGRVDRIDDVGERPGAARSRAAAAASPADFQVGFDFSYSQGLPCTRCLQPVRSEVTAHAELPVRTLPNPKKPVGGAHANAKATAGKDAKAGTAKEKRGAKESPKKAASKHAAPEPEIELEKDELGVLVIEGEHLDTEPLIAEQVLLELPMKPLCGPECRGLCPRCGADRNQVADCCEEPADERFEALGALRDKLSAEGR
jgi:uncharacterized metal-binding protein YceD (DUF177 family)